MSEKQCIKCNKIKPLIDFHKDKSQKDGHISICKICKKKYSKKYYQNNKDINNLKCREYRKKNIKKLKEYDKNKYEKNKTEILARIKKYNYKLENKIWNRLKGKLSTIKIRYDINIKPRELNFSKSEYINYIKSLFKSKKQIELFKNGIYEIDHINNINKFNKDNIKEYFHYRNCQILHIEDHKKKTRLE